VIKFFHRVQMYMGRELKHKMCRPASRVCRTLEKPAKAGAEGVRPCGPISQAKGQSNRPFCRKCVLCGVIR